MSVTAYASDPFNRILIGSMKESATERRQRVRRRTGIGVGADPRKEAPVTASIRTNTEKMSE